MTCKGIFLYIHWFFTVHVFQSSVFSCVFLSHWFSIGLEKMVLYTITIQIQSNQITLIPNQTFRSLETFEGEAACLYYFIWNQN